MILASICILAAERAVPVDTAPPMEIDVGILAGRGFAAVNDEEGVLGRWSRVGPEVVGSVLGSSGFSVGFGLGYQVGYYNGDGATFRRHEISTRFLVRYHLAMNAFIEHAFAMGIAVNDSHVGPLDSTVRDANTYAKDNIRATAFISYWPSIRLTDHTRLGVELSFACGPSPFSLEGLARLGVQYRFK